MKREDVLEIILTTKIIAVIRMADQAKLRPVVEAIRRGGVMAIEITLTTPGALDSIRDMIASKPAGVLVGAGTVLDAGTAASVIQAGADFVVSPVLDREVVRVCRERDTFVAPGAFTPTEILSAWRLGADVVKVFPASAAGPKLIANDDWDGLTARAGALVESLSRAGAKPRRSTE